MPGATGSGRSSRRTAPLAEALTRPPTPWSFTVDELVAAGIDDVGVFQPLLRGRTDDETWPARRRSVIADLEGRGLLTPEGDGWTPAGELATIMVTRAVATSVAVLTVEPTAGPASRSYLLGRFAGDEGLMRLDQAEGSVLIDFVDRVDLSRRVVDAVGAGARAVVDLQRLLDPAIPMRRARLVFGPGDTDGTVATVVGVRNGEDTDSWEARLDDAAALAICAAALIGDELPAT
jgi:hypothetical protein